MAESTDTLLQAIIRNASMSPGDMRSLPPAAYHDAGLFQLETESIFRSEWICIGREREITRHGDYICMDVADFPVFVIRQRDNSVKAFANVCRHRASQLLSGESRVSRISCPYHSWTYDLEGQLVGAPHMQKTHKFSVEDYRLQELACECWLGFVYVCTRTPTSAVHERLGDLEKLLAEYRVENYVPVFSKTEIWQTNWKCLVENFIDAYHIHRVHQKSFARYGSSEDRTSMHSGSKQFSYHTVVEDQGRKSVSAHPDNSYLTKENRNRTWLINIFPSHTIQLQPDMLWYLSILPRGIGEVAIRWAVSIPGEYMQDAAAGKRHAEQLVALLETVNAEDRPVVEGVFKATVSEQAMQGPLSWLESNVKDFGCYLAWKLGAS